MEPRKTSRSGRWGLAASVIACLVSAAAPAAERVELRREEIGSYEDFRFVAEQKLVFSGSPGGPEDVSPMETTLIVEKAGRPLARHEGWRWQSLATEVPLGADVTGDGTPSAVFANSSGGAHCCVSVFIFPLSEPVSPIIVETSTAPSFQKLEGRNGYVIVTSDDIYGYWRSSFAYSPFPQIILTYQGNGYQANATLAKRPALDDDVLNAKASAIRDGAWQLPELPAEFLSLTLDLIYSGNAGQALTFIDRAWNPAIAGKSDFLIALFQCRLPRSAYWPTIAAMNQLPVIQPRADCDQIDKNIY